MATRMLNPVDAVLPIVAQSRDGRLHSIGCCFVVAVYGDGVGALALTAQHNLQFVEGIFTRHLPGSHHSTLKEFRPQRGPLTLGSGVGEVYVFRHAEKIAPRVLGAWGCPISDIALMHVRGSEHGCFTDYLPLDSTPLQAGERVAAWAQVPQTQSEEVDYETGDFSGVVGVRWMNRPARVVRDCREGIPLHGGPGFLIDAAIDSGMSGCPVVDQRGYVRGIAVSDVSENAESGAAGSGVQAFAASVRASMMIRPGMSADMISSSGPVKIAPNTPLLEWVRNGVVKDYGAPHEHMAWTQDGDSYELRWRT